MKGFYGVCECGLAQAVHQKQKAPYISPLVRLIHLLELDLSDAGSNDAL